MPALRVTFYSYKGGVGRTLALLNVAALLAMAGRKVLAVDLDLEAPGFGLSSLTLSEQKKQCPGIADWLFERLACGQTPVSSYYYPIPQASTKSNLWLMPAGMLASDLSSRIAEFFQNPNSDTAHLFQLLVTELDNDLKPDYIFFDSRTGLADSAGVCTVELPQVLVAVCGLNEQNINGMEFVLKRLREHPARSHRVATLLALSPVPREKDISEPALVSKRIKQAQIHLLAPILDQELANIQKHFPQLTRNDICHLLEYDPMVPLIDELQISRDSTLVRQYRRLARTLTRARYPHEKELLIPENVTIPEVPILLS